MEKELSKEEILNNVHWQFVVNMGISSIHTKTFPEAYKQQALKAMQEYADQQSKKEAIALLQWLNRRDARYAPMYDGDTWAGNEEDITTDEFYKLYCDNKTIV